MLSFLLAFLGSHKLIKLLLSLKLNEVSRGRRCSVCVAWFGLVLGIYSLLTLLAVVESIDLLIKTSLGNAPYI